MEAEKIKSRIDYIKSTKIVELENTIAFYKGNGSKKDLTEINENLSILKKEVENLQNVLDGKIQKKTGLKVKVTAHNGVVIIETLDVENFDIDFIPNGNGLIGCNLSDNSRLGISKEAIEIIKSYKKVGDVIGDLMGEENNFTWIGSPIRTLDSDSVVCRYFKLPKGYVEIENVTNESLIKSIDKNNSDVIEIDYKDFKQELWIELSKSGSWKPKVDEPDKSEYVYNDYYSLENQEGARFVGGRIYDKNVKIVNAPDGLISKNEDGVVKVKMPVEVKNEIFGLVKDVFRKSNESSWDIRINDNEIMHYINQLFDLGFDNNVMNPRDGYWRMSIVETPEVIINKLKTMLESKKFDNLVPEPKA